jgi:hypothetical protein
MTFTIHSNIWFRLDGGQPSATWAYGTRPLRPVIKSLGTEVWLRIYQRTDVIALSAESWGKLRFLLRDQMGESRSLSLLSFPLVYYL